MSLPILRMPPTKKPMVSLQGQFANPCDACPLNDVCVTGCCGGHLICEQKSCYRECNICGGGEVRQAGLAGTPAVCSKAPLREIYLRQVRKDVYDFKKQPVIALRDQSIIVGQGAPGVLKDPHPEDCPAVAVNLRHVWSTKGWFSQDIRDYMRLPSKTKLILLTAMHDDVLERAWQHEIQNEDFAKYGFDYWQAVEFSQYPKMSRFNNLWLGYRTLYAIETSQAHFSILYPFGLDLTKGKTATGPYDDCSQKIPQVMINWQYTNLRDPNSFRFQVASVKRFIARAKPQSLWFCGVLSYEMTYNLTLNFADIPCYFLSRGPFLAGQKGQLFNERGKLQKAPTLSKSELSLINQANYKALIEKATQDARLALKEKKHG